MGVHWSLCWVCHLRFEGVPGGVRGAPRNFKGVSRELFDVDSVASSLVGEGTARGGVRISNIVEVGHVRCLVDSRNVGLPDTSRSHCRSGKAKKRGSSASPILKKKVSVTSSASAQTSFEAALVKSSAESGARRSGRYRRQASVSRGG